MDMIRLRGAAAFARACDYERVTRDPSGTSIAMSDRIDAVLALHIEVRMRLSGIYGENYQPIYDMRCAQCKTAMPCETVRALSPNIDTPKEV